MWVAQLRQGCNDPYFRVTPSKGLIKFLAKPSCFREARLDFLAGRKDNVNRLTKIKDASFVAVIATMGKGTQAIVPGCIPQGRHLW
jgi:hypothetical protein